ncbi:MAG: type II secretion system protein GspG [Planctomycetes bacterium]|nr:type II secretion system protein GspG [Planctomycetota bacterium]
MRICLPVAIALGLGGCAKNAAETAAPMPPPPAAAPAAQPSPGKTEEVLRSRVRKAWLDIMQIEMAAKLFLDDYDHLPALLSELIEPPAHPDGMDVRPYIEPKHGVPLDPWGNEFIFEARGDEIFILSLGPDGEPGGGDDISNQKKESDK